MSKIKRLLAVLSLVLAIAAATVLAACGGTKNPPQPESPTYTLNKTEVTLELGASETLVVTPTPADGNVEWITSDESCVTVDNGTVNAVGYGSATVTAIVDGTELTCAVAVPADYAYALSETQKSLKIGGSVRLAVTVTPEKVLGAIVWKSSNTDVATVADGLVTAIGEGAADITAEVDGKTLKCAVTVAPYEYDYEQSIVVDYGDTSALIAVIVSPDKTTAFTYEVSGTAIQVAADGKITTVGVGSATVVIKDGEKTVGECEVTVRPNVKVTDKLVLHVGDTADITVTVAPQAQVVVAYAVTSGADVASVTADGTVTAIANGEAVVKVTVDGKDYMCNVTVSDVHIGGFTVTELEMDKDHPIDISSGAEYWEQYIAFDEVNHKKYDTADEDIIENIFPRVSGEIHYLSDYKAWLAWSGGATRATCSCGKCSKDTQNGGDGGWDANGTKSYYSQNHGVNGLDLVNTTYAFNIKVFPGASVIRIYTGGYEMSASAAVKTGETVLGETTFTHAQHMSDVVEISVDVKEATTLAVVFTITDAKENGFISFCAASVSGDTYRLAKYSTRLVDNGTEKITVLKNGEETTENIAFSSSDPNVATVDADGIVTAVADGTAVIAVNANGRVRRFNVRVGYEYRLEQDNVSMLVGQTHDITIVSEPSGSTASAAYESNDTAVVTVDGNGRLTAVAAGTTTVDVTVGGNTLTVSVTVEDKVAVTSSGKSFTGEYIDFTANDVIYWEYYLFDEITSPTDKTDLIDGTLSGKSGETNGYSAFINFVNGTPKRDSFDDAAFRKYSKGTDYTFNVAVPEGRHEIRVYTGAWENTINKTSLWNGDKELAAYTTPKTPGGAQTLVTFDVTAVEAETLTVKIEATEGDNCRMHAMSIVDKSIAAVDPRTTTVTVDDVKTEELLGTGASTVNLSEIGTLDWAAYKVQPSGDATTRNVSKNAADYIGETSGFKTTENGWDYRAAITWNDGDGEVDSGACKDGDLDAGAGHNNFLTASDRGDIKIKVNADVKTITVLATSFSAAYAIIAYDSDGNLLVWKQIVEWRRDQNVAYSITLNIEAQAEEEITVGILKANDGANVGVAAVAVGG